MPKKKPVSEVDGHLKISELGVAKRQKTKGSSTPPPSLIERTNSLPLEELKTRFLDSSLLTFSVAGPAKDSGGVPETAEYNIELYTSSSLPDDTFQLCFDLLEANLSESYKLTSKGWQPKKKKEEMRHPAMRYLILTKVSADEELKKKPDEEEEEAEPNLIGFLEFMVTEEEGWEVIYTYELEIIPSHQNRGLGKRLMDVAEEFGKRVGVEMAMLTVFDSNKGARRFYERHGYEIDIISPEPKVLRNGQIKQPTFHILSKSYERVTEAEAEDEDEPNLEK